MMAFFKWSRMTGELPFGYQAVGYLESTGTQYIDTGVVGGTNAEYELVFSPLSTSFTSYEQFFAGNKLSTSAPKIYRIGSSSGISCQNSALAGGVSLNLSNLDDFHTVVFQSGIVYADGTQVAECGTIGWGSVTFWIFNAHEEPTLYSTMRLKSLIMKTNGIEVRNFMPCLDGSGEPCLYDKVNRKTYYGIGTESFLYG